MKKQFTGLLLFAVLGTLSFAENTASQEAPQTDTGTTVKHSIFGAPFKKPESFKEFFEQTSVTLSFEPSLILNTESKLKSAPSPVVYPFSMGFVWPDTTFVSIQPRLAIFANYYLWDGKNALPAEIENRTVTALSFLIDIPAVFTFRPAERHSIEAGIGPSFLLRFGFLSNGVDSSDPGESGSASGDVSEINSWFWSNANFFYINVSTAYLFNFTGTIQAGPELIFHLPFGSIISGRGIDAAIFSAGIKVRF